MTTAVEPPETLVGKPVRRVEDASLLTGEMQFLDDLKLPGMAHAAIVRSPYAHARIKAIDTTNAAAATGVIAVYTGKDFEDLPPLLPGQSLTRSTRLPGGTFRFPRNSAGQAISGPETHTIWLLADASDTPDEIRAAASVSSSRIDYRA